MKIGFIGLGKLGKPVSEAMVEAGHTVDGYDINGSGSTQSIKECVACKDIVFVAVPTPHDPRYDGRYVSSNLPPKDFDYTIARATLAEADLHMTPGQILVLISTVLPGTCTREFIPIIKNAKFVYNPYLIAMGTVKEDFLKPEMIMMGGVPCALVKLEAFYRSMCTCDRYIRGTLEECESIKIFYNTFITMKITLVNMIQDVAMGIGNMDVDVVTKALAESTNRIMSPKYMKAGMGDGGSCHPRDNIALRWLSKELDLGYDIFGSLIQAREEQARNMATYVQYIADINGLPIVIVGKGFKPDVLYEDGSPSILVSQFINCTFDDFSKPAVFLLTHSQQTTFDRENIEYSFPEGSVIIDPWRERVGSNVIHYGKRKSHL